MSNIRNISLAAIAALALCACNDNDKEDDDIPDYRGTVTVVFMGETYPNEDIGVNYSLSSDGKSATISMLDVQFVPMMPVTISADIAGLTVTHEGSKTLLSGTEIIPTWQDGAYERYKVTDFSGEISGDQLTFSLNFGSYPTTFTGTRVKK